VNKRTEEAYGKIEEALEGLEAIEVSFLRKKHSKREEFLVSVQEWIEDKGFCTPKQAAAVDDIYLALQQANVLEE